MLASEISWGSVAAGGRAGPGALPGGVVAAFGSAAGAGTSEVRGSGGLGEALCSTGRALGLGAAVPELLRFWRSLRVSRGGGCFSLWGERDGERSEEGTETSASRSPGWGELRDRPDPAYHRTCWDSGGKDCCSRVLPRRSKSSRPLVQAEGLGEDVPASALTGGAATAGAMLSSLLSDDCGKSAQESPPSPGRVVRQHRPRDLGRFLTYPISFSTTLPTCFHGSQHVTWKLFQPLLSPAWAGCGAGSFRPAREEKKSWSQATKWVRALNGA